MIKKYLLASINIYILIINIIIYIIGLIYIDLLPITKDLIIIIVATILIILSMFSYFNKNNHIYNSGILITIILNVIIIYSINNLNNNYDYLNNIINKKYHYETYEIYVLKKTPTYNDISTLNNKKIGILSNNSENVCNYLNNKIKIECKTYKSINEINEAITTGEIQSFSIAKNKYSKIDTNNILKKQSRKIDETKIKDTI
jgi:hypothetical protein